MPAVLSLERRQSHTPCILSTSDRTQTAMAIAPPGRHPLPNNYRWGDSLSKNTGIGSADLPDQLLCTDHSPAQNRGLSIFHGRILPDSSTIQCLLLSNRLSLQQLHQFLHGIRKHRCTAFHQFLAAAESPCNGNAIHICIFCSQDIHLGITDINGFFHRTV